MPGIGGPPPGGGLGSTTQGGGGGGSTVSGFIALHANVTAAVGATRTLETAMKSLAATTQAAATVMKTTLDGTAAAAAKAGQAVASAASEWQEHQLAMLEKLRQMIIPFEGSDAGSKYSFDKIIEDQIAKVRAGEETAQEAIQELQRQFGSVYGVFQRKFFGSQDPGAQEFLLALEQFTNSGNINI